MLVLRHGNLFESGCEAFVNPVNCKGVIGSGITKQFHALYPEIYPEYYKACSSGKLLPGIILPSKTANQTPKWILNFPTKYDWKDSCQLDWIEAGLIGLTKAVDNLSIQLVAVPPLGCEPKGLDWSDVYKLMYKHLSSPDVKYFIYPPK